MILTDDEIRKAAEFAAEQMWPESGYVGWTEDDAVFHRKFVDALLAKLRGGVGLPEPAIMTHLGTDAFTRDQVNTLLAARALKSEQAGEAVARPMETAPRDSTLIRLLVDFDTNSLEDSPDPVWTIGANCFENDDIDEWKFAGWDWSQDCFTEGVGKPIGWLPMLDAAPQPAQPSEPAQPEQGPST